jgi:hypothetical protein
MSGAHVSFSQLALRVPLLSYHFTRFLVSIRATSSSFDLFTFEFTFQDAPCYFYLDGIRYARGPADLVREI